PSRNRKRQKTGVFASPGQASFIEISKNSLAMSALMSRIYDSLSAYHDTRLAMLAGLVCLLACYTAFSMMKRLYGQRSRYPWVISAAFVTGCGAWATHLIALLAFKPGVPVAYDVGMTVLAGFVAVAGSGVGYLIARSTERMAFGGAIVGF